MQKLCEAFAVTEEVLRYGYQRAKFTRQEVELIETLRRNKDKLAIVQDVAGLPVSKLAFVREAVRLMQRYPER